MSNDHDLDTFLKENPHPDYIHLVLPGAVVSGQLTLNKTITTETLELINATVYSGSVPVSIENLIVPFKRILAWGSGEIELA
jgi:hypothetical protein